jgi:solute carrier family 35 (UDP-sugar transporter), member A1/2/3
MLKPTLFFLYVSLWTTQGLLIHYFHSTDVHVTSFELVLMQELIKLVVSAFFSWRETPRGNKKIPASIWWYAVPAVLYTMYNNLTYIGLERFPPSTYFVLMQLRIVATGIVSVLMLGRQYTFVQWVGLGVIMVGAMLKERDGLRELVNGHSQEVVGYMIIGAQILLSTSAGVLTEKLLKDAKSNLSTHRQNFFMYFFSVLVNLGLAMGSVVGVSSGWTTSGLPWVIALNGAAMGIVTGFFLKHLDSVAKSIASALELWATLVASHLVFGYDVDWTSDFMGLLVLTVGVGLYSMTGDIISRDKKIR